MHIYWLLFALPLAVLFFELRRLRHRRLKRQHDLMLYSLCQVRDEAALLGLSGQLSEESVSFQFFYSTSATIIHHHRSAGMCFSDLIREVDKAFMERSDKPTEKSLFTELQNGSERLQEIAQIFIGTMERAYLHAFGLIIIDRLIRKFQNHIDYFAWTARLLFVPQAERAASARYSELRRSISPRLQTA